MTVHDRRRLGRSSAGVDDPREGHSGASSHSEQRGRLALHVARPNPIMATWSGPRRRGEIADWSSSISRELGASDESGPTQPSRLLTRQQCVSTGNTCRSSENSITQRAVLSPTSGRAVKNASHSSSFQRASGASVGRPNACTTWSRIERMPRALRWESPPRAMAAAISSTVPFDRESSVGKA